MEWKDLQPIATVLAAIIAGISTAIITLKLQDKKRNDDIDLKAFETSLAEIKSYHDEKGKNTATKEDVEEITKKVEFIKNEFVATNKLLEWQLSKKANLYKLQAEKEFEVYTKIWDKITELKIATQQLRPPVDFQNPNEPKIEMWNRRYNTVRSTLSDCSIEIEKQRPFYPHSLFLELQNLLQLIWEEVVDFEFSLDKTNDSMPPEAYMRARENVTKILKNINEICNLMRTRISEN